jgi:DNA polymerase alpha-associated DNA helicase A
MNREYDVVIIDEATQALEGTFITIKTKVYANSLLFLSTAECWIALLKAKKAILAGDHLQLPPTIKTPIPKNKPAYKKVGLNTDSDLSFTLFDRLLSMYGEKVKRLLNVQYRMHQKIMEFSSRELYDNKLVADESVAAHVLADLTDVTSSEDTDVPVVTIDTSDTGLGHEITDETQEEEQSKSNELEVELAVHHIKALLEQGVTEEQIGVITPYSAQVAKLKRDIREHWPNIEIGTVDGFQGREKEAILVSLVRSNDVGEVGFLAEKRRLNGKKKKRRTSFIYTITLTTFYIKQWQ